MTPSESTPTLPYLQNGHCALSISLWTIGNQDGWVERAWARLARRRKPGRRPSGHDRLKHCTSLPDLIGRHLLVEYCGRHELGHVPVAVGVEGLP
jgi:hypothetical protein